jgi:hypothetical protein
MNWDALGAIAELAGALGVIASLLYLGRQIRASTRASAVESKLASTRNYTDFLGQLVHSPELAELFIRGRKDFQQLASAEKVRFSNLALMSFSFFSAAYFQLSNDALDEDSWVENQAILQYWLRGAGCRDWWENTGRHLFGKKFVDFIDAELRDINAA